ncbi:MAG TPA: discoidin domain-containing protein [Bryobacteraceae bacterium]|nr:discoidin domain-containing protein [Bryobacteraceae bacterium]
MARIFLLALISFMASAQNYTLGVGVYPGDPKENFAPTTRIDSTAYRNLALHRPAYQSSSYDYNLTAQLVTDGIKESALPRWISVSTSQQGVLAKNDREHILDGNWVTSADLAGPNAWVQLELAGGAEPFEIDRFDIDGAVRSPTHEPEVWACIVSGSDDGANWKKLGQAEGMARPSGDIHPSVNLSTPARYRFYRIAFSDPRARSWQVNDVNLFRAGKPVHIAGPYQFSSAWKSAGAGEEWVYVDLGAPCTFDRVTLYWIRRAAQGSVQASDDAANWKPIAALPATGSTDDLKLTQPTQGRYVRVLMQRPAEPAGYILSEIEVFGKGGLVAQPKPAPQPTATQLELAAGAWRIERDSLVKTDGPALSKAGFDDSRWVIATVPGTALVSYLNAGAIPDPNYSDNQLAVSDSFFYADFWYRNEFTVPPAFNGRNIWLNFDGINWKADIYLNGEKLGRIDGGFMRGRFDVTAKLHPGQKNALAVLVLKNATPGSVKEKNLQTPDKNGGALGADNPTFHASIGWDWIPTIRGRDTGIWNRVFLNAAGPVTVEDPFVNTKLPLPETSSATVSVEATLMNHSATAVTGTLRGRFGDQTFTVPVTLEASASKPVQHTLQLASPKLWWPAGYGQPNLYTVSLEFVTAANAVSDTKSFEAGVRQFTYSEEGGALRMWINGRRFIPKGGNWGFGESMLRYRAREYDAAVRYHAEMNFNMIRNWVGQIGEDSFYDACDRNGVVVWQDFWLANPYDGPDPDDNAMFLSNVKDTVLRIRTHPSVGLYVGRNEGFPPKTIDDGIRATLDQFHPGMHYVPSSADGVVSGHGPYQQQTMQFYFSQRASTLFHSEMGMPNVVTLDSLRMMMPESAMWPRNSIWGLHDFTLTGAQNAANFAARIEKSFGPADNVADWLWLAQFENYEGYRAMFEAQSKNRMGLLIWMSHPCWPSFVWQTYDYYLEPTAGYFGAKKASEPLHIQWNAATDNVEVVNYSAGAMSGLIARVQILNLDGTMKWEKSVSLDSAEDSVATPMMMEYPGGLTPVYFIRLELRQGQKLLSDNFYWRGQDENYQALRLLPKVTLNASTNTERRGDGWFLTTTLTNPTPTPALMVRLKAVREKSGDRILPAIYSDGYIALMPGETRIITTELRDADTRGENPRIQVEGFNQ